jgi:hypothetical protein
VNEERRTAYERFTGREYRGSFAGGKARTGRDAYYSPSSSAEDKSN